MAGVAAAVVGGLALAGGAAARGLGESRSWMESIVEEAKAQVRRSVPSFLPPPLEPPAPPAGFPPESFDFQNNQNLQLEFCFWHHQRGRRASCVPNTSDLRIFFLDSAENRP